MTDSIQYPTGFGLKDIVSWGTTAMVCLDAASQTVIKTAHDNDKMDRVAVEKRIYERFQQYGEHSGLLRYYGPYESGIRLEYAPKWNLSTFLRKHPKVDVKQRLRWAQQITDTLCFVHAANVIHGDLTSNNVFMTEELDAKLADFGGSSLDGSSLLVVVNISHQYPGPLLSIQADIFALGSVLYNIMTGAFPYQELLEKEKENEIKALYEKGKFPKTDSLGPIGTIITKCWQAKYDSAVDVRKDIEAICQAEPTTIINATHPFRLSVLLLTIGIVAAVLSRRSAWRLIHWN